VGAYGAECDERSDGIMRAKARVDKKLEAEINAVYCASCAGVEIDLFDIPKVFDVGRKAKAEGRDLKEAIVAFVQTVRKN
jgi:hypothetical protein